MEENNHKYCANNWYVTETHIGAHFYELIYKDQSQGNEAKRSVFVYAIRASAVHAFHTGMERQRQFMASEWYISAVVALSDCI